MTKAERRKINRDNAQHSTGPKTEAGKAVSRQNATTHGMRTRVLILPDEDAATVQAQHDAWNDHYNPQTPGDQQLVNQAVGASLQFERCAKYQHAIVSKQVRDARNAHDESVCDELERLKALLKDNPARAVRLLSRFAVGCQWMTQEWQRLRAQLVAEGAWCDSDRDQACRLFGIDPELDRLPDDATLYTIVLYNLLATTTDQDKALWDLLRNPEVIPDTLGRSLARGLPNAGGARAHLLGEVDRTIGELATMEADLAPLAELDREEAGDRALLIQDGPMARLLLRYQSEARTSFHRAYSALEKAKKSAESMPATVVSPNEPKEVPTAPATASTVTICDKPSVPISEARTVHSIREANADTAEGIESAPSTLSVVATDRSANPIGPMTGPSEGVVSARVA